MTALCQFLIEGLFNFKQRTAILNQTMYPHVERRVDEYKELFTMESLILAQDER